MSTFNGLVQHIVDIINVAVPLLITLGILFFFYHSGRGVFGSAKDNAEARAQLKGTLLWGVIIIFVMVSIWGILHLIGGEFQLIRSGF